jgi:hypothetical protein
MIVGWSVGRYVGAREQFESVETSWECLIDIIDVVVS